MTRLLSLCVLLCSVLLSASAQAKEPSAKDLEFFESKIRPVLVSKCYRCHSVEAQNKKRLKGRLLLDTRAGIRKGGETGPAVVPGDLKKSLLIKALHFDKLEMPPSGRLPENVVADFEKWVRDGAADPRDGKAVTKKPTIDIEKGKQHWAFQPLHKVKVPTVKNQTWKNNEIDAFVLARLEAKGIQPSAIADRQKLCRRVYYGLTGLPPTPEELKAFLNDSSPKAYENLIDHLLRSPQYGERWARHWLDLARFAESNGYAFDKDRGNAFQYRDFVIKALNQDMPYDQFVRWQLAGDQMEPTNPLAVAATGFIVAGPYTTQQTAKERERSRYEQLDDMVSTLGTSMLGLTVGCARCHDHKYDPLPQHDYYRMISTFREVGFADVPVITNSEEYQKAKAEHDKKVATLQAQVRKYVQTELVDSLEQWIKDRPAPAAPPALGPWHHVGPFPAANVNQAFRKAFPPEKKIDLKQAFLQGKLKWQAQSTWKDGVVHNPFTQVNAANYLTRTITSETEQSIRLSLGSDDGIKVWLNGKEVLAKNVARGAAADQEMVTVALNKGTNHLLMKIVNGGGASGFYFRLDRAGPPAAVAQILKSPFEKWDDKQRAQVLNWYRTQDTGWQQRQAEVVALQKKAPKPQQTVVYAIKKRGTTYQFGKDTYNVYHLSRGNVTNKEKLAEPGYLQVLTEDFAKAKDSTPRIALANWITDHEKGAGQLLARVIVNRLWQHHFGRGIVATPSDFGTRGEKPTHPEFLDWLAQELIRHNWRLKPIHKLMLMSSAYRQANQSNEVGQRLDPDNLLYWRRQPERLEAEIIRDALLAVSGTLEKKMFGPGTLNEQSNRRSIYLTVKRSRRIPILQLFDAPDTMQGIGQRETTTVAPQALAMLNSSMVRQLATRFAQRVRPDAKVTLEQTIERAYELALSRAPKSEEKQKMLAFLQMRIEKRGGAANAESLAVIDFCHVLLCTNEFVYVD